MVLPLFLAVRALPDTGPDLDRVAQIIQSVEAVRANTESQTAKLIPEHESPDLSGHAKAELHAGLDCLIDDRILCGCGGGHERGEG